MKSAFASMAVAVIWSLVVPCRAMELEEGFARPPWSSQPLTWWHWMNGNVTKEGIIVSWPAGLKAHGELRTDPGQLIDRVPTVLELTGGNQPAKVADLPVPPLPGKSLVPDFAHDGMLKHDYLWWNHNGNRTIRIGDWKPVADREKAWELFALRQDRSETKNLAAKYPKEVKELETAWTKHAAELHTLALQDRPQAQPGRSKNAKPNQQAVE